ncbi:lamin tail domain-containing protein [Solitalea sp. MAHUQ-68]|uniref:Lamin tail domain-containing protein n=1 Tax=Solitalea agri TaxID=2953739 RepID=A0A9X2F6E7_9SPHI|nr:lamin tail domain-containing protein [Solitalea agri]MCO4293236.1 lamin tail domain-containing protein [Solitalea agri]
MKNILCILLSFLYLNSYSQLKDSFADGNLSSNPQWNGNIDAWFINTGQQLQTKSNSATAQVYLSTESNSSLNTKWKFSVKLSFNPSSSNQARVYLMADQADLNKPLNGYFVQIGENGSTDSYDLFKQTGSSISKIIDGPSKTRKDLNLLEAEIEVTRTEAGLFELKTRMPEQQDFVSEGTATDLTHIISTHFGVEAKYTATRSNQFYFDDFEISELVKPKPIYPGKPGDIIFTELFPDPSPQIDLPTAEFVEIYNTSDSLIELKNWTYSDATTTFTFKSGVIQPKTYLILCPIADTADYAAWGSTKGLSPWPSLNNSGDALGLKNAEGTVIDQISYTDDWYRNTEKKAGGFTLERNESMAFCTAAQQWKASSAKQGGTPGMPNSISSEGNNGVKLSVITAQISDSVTITTKLSAFVDSISLKNATIKFEPSMPIKSIELTGPYFDQLIINFSQPLLQGENYRLSISNLSDCYGNQLEPSTLNLLRPSTIAPGDILINEILFNPKPGGVDFVEVINHSDKVLDLKELKIGTLTSKDSIIYYTISDTTSLFHPKEIRALTADVDILKQQYLCKNEKALIQLKTMPAYNNDKGAVILKSENRIIDRFDYNEKMHFALINNPEGVSLERINLEFPTNQTGNFHSTASTSGFATPGYENSQTVSTDNNADEVTLSSNVISPDNDGVEDVLAINYHFNQVGLMANISIFNRNGKLVKKLRNNELLGTDGSIIWDGLDQQSQPVLIGPHLIVIETFSTSGKINVYKKSVVVAQKFN